MHVAFYKLQKPLVVNYSDRDSIIAPEGQYVVYEADGSLSVCEGTELQANLDRVLADKIKLEEQLELERQRQQEQQPEPIPDPIPEV